MGHQENSGFSVDDSTEYTDKNSNGENEKENNEDKNSNRDTEKEKSQMENLYNDTEKTEAKKSDKKLIATPEKKKRKHKKYKTSINHSALKELEGTTANSFLDLAKAVILIDSKQYDEEYLALSKERKNDFKRLIEHYAVIDTIGKRKYHIKRVYSKQQREELNELEINYKRDNKK